MKNLSFEWLVGLRYTRAGRRSGRNSFISFISLISMLGISLGVAAMIIVISVMNGFQKEVRDRMLSVLAHIEVFDASGALPDWKSTALEVQKNKAVTGTAPYVDGQAMIIREDVMRGVILRGVLPEEEPRVSDVASKIKYGKWADLRPGEFNIVLGVALANSLHVRVGEKITLAAPEGQMTPAGMVPRLKAFNVVGIFEAGHYEYDAGMAFMHIEDAQKFFRLSAPSGLRLRIQEMLKAPQIALELSRSLSGDLLIRDWTQQNKTYFAAVKAEKTMMFIILTLIIAVAAFNLVSTLVMTVTEKQADIAIMRTLGAAPSSIMKIFIIQGAIVGLFGTLLGVGGGLLVSFNIDVIVPFIEHILGIQVLSKEVYVISKLPSDVQLLDVTIIGSVSLVLALLATIYPSWRASRTKPAEALRYE
ncbi:lipoprotein-releasing ABC transporter permease subunit [Undibacterium sp. CY18W]|uniref:Lipoprotein-releasing ABC transporter permease subunit n=1 Tax=Undibacterium hunanense TaxID=2762292 RepID=A0ABR6ZJ37_9BURK|nr:lipoprotein-releasing ABC transporter permease subunit [Undibacterium hunanense]MBC3915917.1 lipoprotein-releasing ABC transporter permease subunit [Undibacterium hunanense]